MRSVVLVAMLAATPASADDVSLADVLAAVPNAPAAQVAHHEIAAADAHVDAAGAWPNPALRVETNRLTAKLVVGATFPLPVFGTIGAAKRAASAEADVARSQTVVDNRELRRRAVVAWIALARAEGDVTVTTTAVAQVSELERIARGRLDAGTGAEVDVSMAGAARVRAELAVATAKRAREAASAELAGVLGWDPTKPLIAVGDLPGRDAITLEALRAKLPVHPNRAVAQRKVAAADAARSQIGSERWPSLAFEAQASLFDPGTPGTDVLLALVVDVPVFAHVGDRARAARATAAAERARLAATEHQLDAALVAAFRRWQSVTEQLVALDKDIVPAQTRAAQLSAQAFREGARDLASAIQADRDLAAVRAEVTAARAELASAWADLMEAAGDDL